MIKSVAAGASAALSPLPGVVVAVVVQRVSDSDLGPVESLRVCVDVGDVDRKHFVSVPQVQPPPGADVVAGVRARTVFPLAVAVAIDGVRRGSELVQSRLRGLSLEGQVLSCRDEGRVQPPTDG